MRWINKWKNDYRRWGYKFMDRDEIYEDVTNILQSVLTGGRQQKYKKSKKNRKYKIRKTRRK